MTPATCPTISSCHFYSSSMLKMTFGSDILVTYDCLIIVSKFVCHFHISIFPHVCQEMMSNVNMLDCSIHLSVFHQCKCSFIVFKYNSMFLSSFSLIKGVGHELQLLSC